MDRLAQLLALVLLSALAAGCGGEGDAEEIAEVIRVSATTDAPANCTKLVTRDFLEQTEFAKGEAAVRSCEERDPGASADSVEVADVVVDDGSATAEASVRGSAFDGQTLAVSLVERDGEWRLDRITGFRGFDKGAFLRAYERALTAPPDALPPSDAGCIVRLLARSDTAKLQDVLLAGDPAPLRRLFALCA